MRRRRKSIQRARDFTVFRLVFTHIVGVYLNIVFNGKRGIQVMKMEVHKNPIAPVKILIIQVRLIDKGDGNESKNQCHRRDQCENPVAPPLLGRYFLPSGSSTSFASIASRSSRHSSHPRTCSSTALRSSSLQRPCT